MNGRPRSTWKADRSARGRTAPCPSPRVAGSGSRRRSRTSSDRRFDEVRVVGSVDFYSWPELGRRYIEYAKTHPWKRDKQSLNAYVIEAGSKGDMFPEYAAIFQKKPKLTSAEKCSAGRPGRSNEAGQFLKKEGATGNAEIPLGCAMGFIELEEP